MAKKVAHGGARRGAGRPPKDDGTRTVVIAASVPEDLATKLDTFAETKGWSRSKAVTEALAAMLKRR